MQWQAAKYRCQDGFAFPENASKNLDKDGMFEVECRAYGKYEPEVQWPTCEALYCTELPVHDCCVQFPNKIKPLIKIGDTYEMNCMNVSMNNRRILPDA